MIEFMESSVAPINNVSGLSRRKEGFDSPWGYLLKDKLSLYFTRSFRNLRELFLFENGLFDLCLTFAPFTKETTIVNGGSHLLRAPVFCWGHPYESRHPAVHTANKYPKTDSAIFEGIRLLLHQLITEE